MAVLLLIMMILMAVGTVALEAVVRMGVVAAMGEWVMVEVWWSSTFFPFLLNRCGGGRITNATQFEGENQRVENLNKL